MISYPSLIYYACVAKESSTMLAEFNSENADLGNLAAKCLEKTPPLHSFFSHTIRDKTYTFLIDNPFVYFAIHHENIKTSEGLAFLNGVKDAFNQIIDSNGIDRSESFSSHRFQGELNPVFRQLLASNSRFSQPPRPVLKQESTRSIDTPRGRKIGSVPLLGESFGNSLKKKKKRLCVDHNGDSREVLTEDHVGVSEDGNGSSRELPLSMQKSGLHSMDGGGHQKQAKRVWKKQVWVVLLFDLIVCSILFGVWLWICRGFKCIDS